MGRSVLTDNDSVQDIGFCPVSPFTGERRVSIVARYCFTFRWTTMTRLQYIVRSRPSRYKMLECSLHA